MIALCWHDYAVENGIDDVWGEFHSHVRAFVYGDDNLIAVSDKYAIRQFPFDQRAMTLYMEKHGFTYTTEDKSGSNTVSFREIEDVTFLKRGFVTDTIFDRSTFSRTELVKAPLDINSLIETPLWCRGDMSTAEFANVVDTALSELSLHEADVWDKYAPVINRIGNECYGYVPKIPFTQRDFMVRTSGMKLPY
jgi:hypothetical protein